MNVRDDTSPGDGGLDQGVELLITTNGQLQVAGRDALDLKVLGRIAGKLKNLSGEVLHDGGRVDRGRGTDALALGGAALQVAVDTPDRELKPSTTRARLRRLFGGGGLSALASFSSFSFARHDYVCVLHGGGRHK